MNIYDLPKPFFTKKQAEELGLSSRMLSYYVSTGYLERVSQGTYRLANQGEEHVDSQWEEMAIVAHSVKGSVICLVSALNFYGLTDEHMRKYWLAVEHNNSKADHRLARIVRMRNMDIGIKELKMAGLKVRIFDVERTIIDSFRFLDIETAIKALKLYASGKCGRPNFKKLSTYSKELRVNIQKYLVVLSV